jgi:hypothetical protein
MLFESMLEPPTGRWDIVGGPVQGGEWRLNDGWIALVRMTLVDLEAMAALAIVFCKSSRLAC